MDMELIHLVSEAQEIYRKKSPIEQRKRKNRKKKAQEIARVCGVGLDYYMLDRHQRRAYEYIASCVRKIQRMESELLRMTAIMEMLQLSGVLRVGESIWMRDISINVDIEDLAKEKPNEVRMIARGYIEIKYDHQNEVREIRINGIGDTNIKQEIEDGVPPSRVASMLTYILERLPEFREFFIKEVAEKLNKRK
jgi:hypothetical protein|nr:MAG TPA: hypothetical protein [Crassvirales sp.]